MDLTMHQVADAWIAAGGPRNRAVEWVGICWGESSGRTDAVSVDGALGLFQIMPFNWGPLGLDERDWQDPVTNARAAVIMSGHGTNCAAWDSAYADIQASGRYRFLGYPEKGSADYNNALQAAVVLGRDKLGGAVPHGGFTPSKSLDHAVSHLNNLATKLLPQLVKIDVAQRMAANRMFTPGWRP
jgi:Transglycosylase SLT domain